jgi:shikimate dehydrogenase
VPYKEAVLPLLDEADELANLIGAVNTIAKRDDRLVGFNTDVHGFLEALRKEGNFDPEGKVIAILGAGGVARAVSFALVQQKASELNIFNRSFERSERLANNLRGYIDKARLKTEIFALPWRNMARRQTFDHCQLIVNCTTIGMKYSSQEGQSPLTMEAIPADILVYDLVYNPWPTPLLKLAQKAGANILSGLPMLVYQGAASFKLWTAREAPLNIMFGKAEEVLKR